MQKRVKEKEKKKRMKGPENNTIKRNYWAKEKVFSFSAMKPVALKSSIINHSREISFGSTLPGSLWGFSTDTQGDSACRLWKKEREYEGISEFENSWLFFRNSSVLNSNFFVELSHFSKSRWVTLLQISQKARYYPYLSNDTKNNVLQCSISRLALHKVRKQRPIGMPSKAVHHPRKLNNLDIIR
jgi:hypothetical protein